MIDAEFSVIETHVKKKIKKEGKFGKRPALGWVCGITILDECEGKVENLEITVGNGCSAKERLIETCVESMRLEEESFFIIELEEKNILLKISVTLKYFTEKPYIFQWSEEEKLEACNFYKEKGAELFRKNNVEEAFYKFGTALKFTLLLDAVLEMDESEKTINNLRTDLYNNLARCHLHYKNYSSVIKLCSDSLKLQKTVKAYYRRAAAYIEIKEYDKAEMDLVELLKIEPKNKAALEKYHLVRKLDNSNRENYESIIRKMFS